MRFGDLFRRLSLRLRGNVQGQKESVVKPTETSVRHSPAAPRHLEATEDITAWFSNHKSCPDCGTSVFHKGPRGGASQNIRCSNVLCSAQFNVLVVDGQYFFAERIHRQPTTGNRLH